MREELIHAAMHKVLINQKQGQEQDSGLDGLHD
jgi:hypothetical protein